MRHITRPIITAAALVAIAAALVPGTAATAAPAEPARFAEISDAHHTTIRTVIAVTDMLVSVPNAAEPQSAHTTFPAAGTRGPVVIDGACLTFVRGLDHGYRTQCSGAPEQQFDAVPTSGGVMLRQDDRALSASKRESIRTLTLQTPGEAKYLQVLSQH